MSNPSSNQLNSRVDISMDTSSPAAWPPESLLFKTPIEEPESIIVPVENFDFIPHSIAENKQMAREGIGFQNLINQYHESIDGFTHIRGTGG